MTVVSSIKFLARQGIAIRGHVEEEGNLIQFLKCRAEDIQGLNEWIKNGKYLSHDIVNEILEMMAHSNLKNILASIKATSHFAIIADETQDVSGMEQFSILIRWVDVAISFMKMSLAW